jgi:hypothetical protein
VTKIESRSSKGDVSRKIAGAEGRRGRGRNRSVKRGKWIFSRDYSIQFLIRLTIQATRRVPDSLLSRSDLISSVY